MNDELCQRFDLATHLGHCEQIFVAAIETYDVLVVPSFENIIALTMGVCIPNSCNGPNHLLFDFHPKITTILDAQISG